MVVCHATRVDALDRTDGALVEIKGVELAHQVSISCLGSAETGEERVQQSLRRNGVKADAGNAASSAAESEPASAPAPTTAGCGGNHRRSRPTINSLTSSRVPGAGFRRRRWVRRLRNVSAEQRSGLSGPRRAIAVPVSGLHEAVQRTEQWPAEPSAIPE
jgi:hypothetical protein